MAELLHTIPRDARFVGVLILIFLVALAVSPRLRRGTLEAYRLR